jgi:hypothetical protein
MPFALRQTGELILWTSIVKQFLSHFPLFPKYYSDFPNNPARGMIYLKLFSTDRREESFFRTIV